MEITYRKEKHGFPTAIDVIAIGTCFCIGFVTASTITNPLIGIGITFTSAIAIGIAADKIEESL